MTASSATRSSLRGAAAEVRLPYAVLPLRRARTARTRAPIRQHRFDKVEPVRIVTRKIARGYGNWRTSRRDHSRAPGTAITAVSCCAPATWVFVGQDLSASKCWLRRRRMPTKFLVLGPSRFPGAPHAGPLPQRERAGRSRTLSERFRPRGSVRWLPSSREPPERRRQHHQRFRRHCDPIWTGWSSSARSVGPSGRWRFSEGPVGRLVVAEGCRYVCARSRP